MTVNEYREKLIEIFHETGHDEYIALMVSETEFGVLKDMLEQDCDKDCENCDRCVDDKCPYDNMPRIIHPAVKEPCETSTDEPMTMIYPTIFCEDTISRAEVMSLFKTYWRCFADQECVDLFKDVIRQLPSVQPKPIECEDAISRQAILDKLDEWDWQELYLPVHFKENIIDELPSVQPIHKGHWIIHKKGDYEFLECDKCQTWFRHDHLIRNSFCPNCSADMRGTE